MLSNRPLTLAKTPLTLDLTQPYDVTEKNKAQQHALLALMNQFQAAIEDNSYGAIIGGLGGCMVGTAIASSCYPLGVTVTILGSSTGVAVRQCLTPGYSEQLNQMAGIYEWMYDAHQKAPTLPISTYFKNMLLYVAPFLSPQEVARFVKADHLRDFSGARIRPGHEHMAAYIREHCPEHSAVNFTKPGMTVGLVKSFLHYFHCGRWTARSMATHCLKNRTLANYVAEKPEQTVITVQPTDLSKKIR